MNLKAGQRALGTSALLALVFLGCSRSPKGPQTRDGDRPSVTVSSSTASPAPGRGATCIGPQAGTSFAVYLHGIDAPTVSDQELSNRANLARVADALSLRIALPRSTRRCQNDPGLLCWGWAFDEPEIKDAAAIVDQSAKECFGARPFGVIGFSNGGYLLSKLLRTCEMRETFPRATWTVMVGSSLFTGPLEDNPPTLAGCGHVVMLAGTADTYNRDPDNRFLNLLKAKGGNVESVTFDGGHLVPDEPLKRALLPLLQR